jgi:hypothetical protein
MNEQDREPIITLALLAALADGQASDAEKEALRASAYRLGLVNFDELAARAATADLGAVVARMSDAEARATYEEYVAKYGEDNAAYLMEALGGWRSHYDRAALVDMAVADPRAAAVVEAFARDDAARRGWAFEKLAGELILVRRLVDADWGAEDFLVLQPGERLAMSYDEAVIRAEPAD